MNFKQLLNEEEALDTTDKLKNAVKKGRVPGIKPDTPIIDTVYKGVLIKLKEVPSIYRNAAIKLALKRIMIHNQGLSDAEAYLLYFKNRNKEEAKTEHKELFNSFENGTIDDISFQEKAKMVLREKPKSIKLYEDDTWLVIIPKNFSASCKYGEGTKWCTTEENGHKSYSSTGDLVVVINKKKNSENNPLAKVQFHKLTYTANDATDTPIKEYEYLQTLPKKVQDILKKYGFSIWNTAIKEAVRTKDEKGVKEALDNGANPNVRFLLTIAVEKGVPSIVKMLLDAGADVHFGDDTPIRNAVSSGNKEIVKILIDAGANVNVDNGSPLYYAITETNDIELLKMLLDAGAKVNSSIIETAKRSAKTERKNPEILKLLQQYKNKKE